MKVSITAFIFCGHAIVASLIALTAHAEGAPWQLVCFERSGLTSSLDRVVNIQQFLRNDSILKSGSCDFAQIPSKSTARFAGFHESPQGFIFPTFQVRYVTTGQRMYAADGVFLSSAWRVSTLFRECRESQFQDICLVPLNCQTLDGLLSNGRVQSYVAVPSSCQTLRTR